MSNYMSFMTTLLAFVALFFLSSSLSLAFPSTITYSIPYPLPPGIVISVQKDENLLYI